MSELMDEYIKRRDAVAAIHDSNMINPIDQIEGGNAILMVPASDVAPVRHGEWRDTGSGQECSVCKEIQYGYDTGRFFCANCGANMDGNVLSLGGAEGVHEKGDYRMTFKEKLMREHPEFIDSSQDYVRTGCPASYGYEPEFDCAYLSCKECWDREIPVTTEEEEAPTAPHEIPQSVRKLVEARIKLLTEEVKVLSEQIKALEAERDTLCDYLRGVNNG